MNKDETLSHKEQRKKLWANAWVHTASASDCKSYHTATKWADEALKAFDERFPMLKESAIENEGAFCQCNQPAANDKTKCWGCGKDISQTVL